jgi:hypothetical protein
MPEEAQEKRRSTAPPSPNSRERVANSRAEKQTPPKRKRGRPSKQAEGERPDELAHLPPEKPRDQRKLIRPDGSLDGDLLLDAFLANATPQQIQDDFGVAPDNFRELLRVAANETLIFVDELLAQLTLKNIARTERLMNTWLPLAQGQNEFGPSDKSAKLVIDLIRLERDLLKDAREELAARSQDAEDGAQTLDDYAAVLDRQIENTFTKGSPMHLFAQSVIGRAGAEEVVEFTDLVVNSDVAPAIAHDVDVEALLKQLEQSEE